MVTIKKHVPGIKLNTYKVPNGWIIKKIVHPKGFEPPSSEPESEILSIELRMQYYFKAAR